MMTTPVLFAHCWLFLLLIRSSCSGAPWTYAASVNDHSPSFTSSHTRSATVLCNSFTNHSTIYHLVPIPQKYCESTIMLAHSSSHKDATNTTVRSSHPIRPVTSHHLNNNSPQATSSSHYQSSPHPMHRAICHHPSTGLPRNQQHQAVKAKIKAHLTVRAFPELLGDAWTESPVLQQTWW
jgi:hypothetical protein